MKVHILFFAFFLTLVSCTTDDNSVENLIIVNGRVERQINGEGIPNQEVFVSIKRAIGSSSGFFHSLKTIDSEEVATDSDGNFSVSINNGNGIDTFVHVRALENDEYPESLVIRFEIGEDVLIKL